MFALGPQYLEQGSLRKAPNKSDGNPTPSGEVKDSSGSGNKMTDSKTDILQENATGVIELNKGLSHMSMAT